MSKFKIKVCPNCGSPDIDYASLESDSGKEFLGIGIPEKYYCKNCGYTGSVILEVDKRKLKNIKFKNINFKKKTKTRRVKIKKHNVRRVELMKPVFVLTVLFFLITSIFFLIPVIKNNNQMPNSIKIGLSETVKGDYKNSQNESTYEKTDISRVREISNALGLENSVGFLTPLFFLFFTLALIILGFSAHLERLKLFQ